MLEQCEPFNQSWPGPSMRHFDIATSLIHAVLIVCRRPLLIDVRTCTRTIHTLASHTSSGTGALSPQVPGIAMAVPERILFVFLFSFISELAGALCVRFLVSTHPCPLRSSSFADVLCPLTPVRARGLITHAHAARQDAHGDSSLAHIPHFIGHWSTIDQGFASPVCRDGSARLHFVLFSHLAHISCIPFHDISRTRYFPRSGSAILWFGPR